MVEGLSEVGAAAWIPLRTERSVVEPRMTKLDRLSRLAVESAKQCGRAWFLRIEQERTLRDALARAAGTRVIVADASGVGAGVGADETERTETAVVRVVVGPEGGWTAEELASARDAGAVVTRFGPHSMRVETAAVAAAAVVLNRFGSGPD
jgi:16S rRNA (uracil1498-N3)-methyltransferase